MNNNIGGNGVMTGLSAPVGVFRILVTMCLLSLLAFASP